MSINYETIKSLATNMLEDAFDACELTFGSEYKKIKIGKDRSIRLNNHFKTGSEKIPYGEWLDNNRSTKYFLSTNSKDERLTVIANSFNYIPMGPKYKEDHKKTYVVPNDQEDTKENIEALLTFSKSIDLNQSRNRMHDYFEFIINKSRNLVNYVKSNTKDKKKLKELTRYLIVGQPGVGKTAAINYLCSYFSDKMINENIIWIRVDLNDRNVHNMSLEKLFYSKFIKTLCHWYLDDQTRGFDRNFYARFKEFIINDLNKTPIREDSIMQAIKNNQIDSFFDLLDLIKTFKNIDKMHAHNYFNRFDLSEYTIEILCDYLLEFLQLKMNYGLIIIFDGMDNFSFDSIQENTFSEWLNSLDYFTDNIQRKYKAVYLITLREYSNIGLKQITGRIKNEFYFQELRVKVQLFHDIMDKRIEYISDKLKYQNLHGSRKQIENVCKNIILWVVSVVAKGEYRYTHNNLKLEDFFSFFQDLHSENIRASMRLFREMCTVANVIYHRESFEILSRDIDSLDVIEGFEGKEWMVWSVLLHGSAYPSAYRNRVTIHNPNHITINNQNRAVIPNIFNYWENNDKIGGDRTPKTLFKIRVIQELLHYKPSNESGIADLVDSIIDKFRLPYGNQELICEVLEMIYNSLVLVESKDFDGQGNKNFLVKLNGFSRTILFDLLKTNIYYEIVCDDTPIQVEFSKYMVPSSRCEKGQSLGDFLKRKMKTLFHFILYLKRIESFEKENFISHANSHIKEIEYNEKYALFTDKTINAIKTRCILSLTRYLHENLGMASEIENYKNEWYLFFGIQQR